MCALCLPDYRVWLRIPVTCWSRLAGHLPWASLTEQGENSNNSASVVMLCWQTYLLPKWTWACRKEEIASYSTLQSRKLLKSASGMVQKTNVQSEEKNYCWHPPTSQKLPGDEIISLPGLRQPLQGHFLALLCFISFLPDGTSSSLLIHFHWKIDVLVVLCLPWFGLPG